MNFKRLLCWVIGLMFVALWLSGCSVPLVPAIPSGAAGPSPGASQDQFTDPFAYCAAVGTVDAPDARYAGPEVPEAIVQGLRQALGTPADAPMDWFVSGTVWRCMDGQVWACFVGANLPCSARADTSRTPTPEMVNFCKENLTSDTIPASVTGRETIYEWRCTNGAPEIVKELIKPDAQGFVSEIWYQINPK